MTIMRTTYIDVPICKACKKELDRLRFKPRQTENERALNRYCKQWKPDDKNSATIKIFGSKSALTKKRQKELDQLEKLGATICYDQ
jgi:hypothetical protein